MKGSPFTQLLLVLLLFTALLPALLAVSRREPPAPETGLHHHHPEPNHISTWATLHFAHAPRHVHLHQGMHNLWHIDPDGVLEIEEEVQLIIEEGRAEVHVHVDWPEGTPETVVELTLEPDELEDQKISAWGGPRLDTVLTFKWKMP